MCLKSECVAPQLGEDFDGIRGLQLGGVEGVWKGSAAVVVRGVLTWFLGKVLVCTAVRLAEFGERLVACAAFFSDHSRYGLGNAAAP